ncbi:hypothetical protein [Sphingomonas sp. RT2P30]|uniref:hypothetical protein n=1 Tax=Parasphingomonas halimpatiens TaxID=3096162 RepID=UPI002FC6127F
MIGQRSMRPAPIIWFERLIVATLLLGALETFMMSGVPWRYALNVAIVMRYLIMAALVVAVMLRISRSGSRIAMWFAILWSVCDVAVVFTIGRPLMLQAMAPGKIPGWTWLGVAHVAVQLIACALLLTPAARRWRRGDSLDRLERTFS